MSTSSLSGDVHFQNFARTPVLLNPPLRILGRFMRLSSLALQTIQPADRRSNIIQHFHRMILKVGRIKVIKNDAITG